MKKTLYIIALLLTPYAFTTPFTQKEMLEESHILQNTFLAERIFPTIKSFFSREENEHLQAVLDEKTIMKLQHFDLKPAMVKTLPVNDHFKTAYASLYKAFKRPLEIVVEDPNQYRSLMSASFVSPHVKELATDVVLEKDPTQYRAFIKEPSMSPRFKDLATKRAALQNSAPLEEITKQSMVIE
jgi:hypothetical protein